MMAGNIDKYLQDQLSNYASQVDGEAIWSAVEKGLKKEPKRRFLWYWVSLGIVGLLLSSTLAFQFFNNPSDPQPASAAIATAVISDEKPQKTAPVTKAIEVENPQEKTTIFSKNKINQTSIKTASSNSEPSAKKSVNPTTYYSTSVNAPQTKRAYVVESTLAPLSTSPNNQESISTSNSVEMQNDNNLETIMFPADTLIEESQSFPTEAMEIGSSASKEIIGTSEEMLETTIPNEETTTVEEELEEKAEPLAAVPPRSSFLRDLTFGFGIRGGIASTITTFKAFESIGQTQKILRENSETSLETINLGIEALVQHESGLYASVGFDYSQYTRRMNFDDVISSVDSVEGVTQIIVNPFTMDTTLVRGLVARTTTSTTVKEIFNTHTFYNIPISLGYRFRYDEWSIGLEGGALINIKTALKGQIRETESTFYSLTDDPDRFFMEDVQVSFRGAVLLGYHFDDSFQLYVGPTFRSDVRLDKLMNPVEQKHTGLGFQLGARYFINAY